MKKEILFQLDMAWKLFEYHCVELDEAEVMWCKSENGLQIRRNGDKWIVDCQQQRIMLLGRVA